LKKEFEDILVGVSNLYTHNGVKSITMDDVSRELGISKKTLYKYVKDKEDLIEKVLNNEMTRIEDGFQKIKNSRKNAIVELLDMNKFVHEMIKNTNPAVLSDLKKYYPQLSTNFAQNRHLKMYNWICDNIKKGKKEGLYRKELKEEVIAKIYVARVEGLRDDNFCSVHELISKKFYTELIIYHIRGISNEKGIQEFEKNSIKLKIK